MDLFWLRWEDGMGGVCECRNQESKVGWLLSPSELSSVSAGQR